MALADENFAQTNQEGADDSSASSEASGVSALTEQSTTPQWLSLFQVFQFAETSGEDFRLYILLDTQSGKSLFCHKEYLDM